MTRSSKSIGGVRAYGPALTGADGDTLRLLAKTLGCFATRGPGVTQGSMSGLIAGICAAYRADPEATVDLLRAVLALQPKGATDG